MSSILHFWKTFWPTVLTSKITSEKYHKKCKNKLKRYPLKLVFRDVKGPKIDPWRPKSPLGVSRAWKLPKFDPPAPQNHQK